MKKELKGRDWVWGPDGEVRCGAVRSHERIEKKNVVQNIVCRAFTRNHVLPALRPLGALAEDFAFVQDVMGLTTVLDVSSAMIETDGFSENTSVTNSW